MALTLGAYAWPAHARPVAAAAVVVFTAVNYLGVAKTARVTRILVVLTLAALAAVVTGALTGPTASPAQLVDWFPNGPLGLLQAAGLLFFAFAGYARIATLGEEVKDPARTIPRAIPLALGIVVVVYAVAPPLRPPDRRRRVKDRRRQRLVALVAGRAGYCDGAAARR
jgi:APA family basic amino acid/polyamine antiporter